MSNTDIWAMFAAAALSNPSLSTGTARDYELKARFGRDASGITKERIAAMQAAMYADELIKLVRS